MFLGSQQDDVGGSGLHGVADAAHMVGAACEFEAGFFRLSVQLAHMGGVDSELAGEGGAKDLVGGDQRAQAR